MLPCCRLFTQPSKQKAQPCILCAEERYSLVTYLSAKSLCFCMAFMLCFLWNYGFLRASCMAVGGCEQLGQTPREPWLWTAKATSCSLWSVHHWNSIWNSPGLRRVSLLREVQRAHAQQHM